MEQLFWEIRGKLSLNNNIILHFWYNYLRYHASRSVLWRLECTKFVFRRGFALDPAGGDHNAPQTP